MSLAVRADQLRAQQIRHRLRYPPNAVIDRGIDLYPKIVPIQHVEKVEPVEIKPAALPYRIGTFTPDIQVTYFLRPARIEVIAIQREVCRRYHVTVADLKSPRRSANVVRPRHIAMYLAKELTTNSYPRIARYFGRDDHTTPLSAVKKIQKLRQVDSALDEELSEIIGLLRSQASPLIQIFGVNTQE